MIKNINLKRIIARGSQVSFLSFPSSIALFDYDILVA